MFHASHRDKAKYYAVWYAFTPFSQNHQCTRARLSSLTIVWPTTKNVKKKKKKKKKRHKIEQNESK